MVSSRDGIELRAAVELVAAALLASSAFFVVVRKVVNLIAWWLG